MLELLAGFFALTTFLFFIATLYRRDVVESVFFNLLFFAVTLYLIGNFFEVSCASVEASMVGFKVAYLGIPFIPPLWFFCVREYCGKKITNKKIVFAVMFVSLSFSMMAQTWEANHLLFQNVFFSTENPISTFQVEPGPLFWIYNIYLGFFNLAGIVTIFYAYIKGTKRFRQQAVLFLVSSLIPFFNTMSIQVRIDSHIVDITPYCLSMTVILFFIGLRFYGIENASSILKKFVLNNLLEGVIIFDKEGYFISANQAATQIFPRLGVLPKGTSIKTMDYLPFSEKHLQDRKEPSGEFSKKQQNGAIRTYSYSISEVDYEGLPLGYTVVFYNITVFKEVMSDLENQAYIDPLTSIYNRAFFSEKGFYKFEQAKVSGLPLSMIMFDLDFFKNINDTYGHLCGDYVLKTIALIGRQNFRDSDIFARYGGEEFCILMPNSNIRIAYKKAEQLRKKINSYVFEYGGHQFFVSASLGVATLEHNIDESIDQLIDRADKNLYKAKSSGRNQVV